MTRLRWDLDNRDASAIIAGYEFHGVEIPEELIAPELQDIEQGLWGAFSDLSTERYQRPIPWSAIVAHHAHNPLGLDLEEFIDIITAMDGAYLTHERED